MYLALVIEGVPFVHRAIDLHLRKRYKRTRVFVNLFVKREQRRGTEGGKGAEPGNAFCNISEFTG